MSPTGRFRVTHPPLDFDYALIERKLLDFDFALIERRLFPDYPEGSLKSGAVWRLKAAEAFGVSPEEVTDSQRRAAKRDYFLRLYREVSGD